jgi:hypothetical protein
VREGEIVMQLRGGKEMVLKPGQTFYEGRDESMSLGGTQAKETGKIRRVPCERERRSGPGTGQVNQSANVSISGILKEKFL